MRAPIAFAAAAAAFLLHSAALGADKIGVLTIDLKIDSKGTARQLSGETSRGTSAQEMHLLVSLASNGELESSNRNDIAGNAAAMQAQMRAANANAPGAADMQAMQTRAKAAYEACKGDQQCLMRVASQISAATSQWQTRAAAEAPQEARYLTYFGYPECDREFTARIASRRDGRFPDVQGQVPFSETTTANYRPGRAELAFLCTRQGYVVVDAKAGKLHATLPEVPIPGRRVREERGRKPQFTDLTEMRLHGEAVKWANAKLAGAALEGTARDTFKYGAPGSDGEGSVAVEMSWSFKTR